MAFENTQAASKSLTENVSSGWDTTFGVSVDVSDSSLVQNFNNATNDIITAGSNLGTSIYNIGSSAASLFEGSQYEAVGDAVGSASINFLNQRIERLKQMWTTTTQISVKSLMDEIAPYCYNPIDAVEVLSDKISGAVGYLLGVDGDDWGEVFANLGTDYTESLMSDPTVLDSVSNLKAVQTVANTLSGITSSIAVVQGILKILEPAFPYLEIAASLGCVFMSCGSTAPEATSRTTQTVQSVCQQLTSLAIKEIKNACFNIKLQVPSLLVGVMEQLSVKEAVASYSSNNSVLSFLNTVFDEQFYQETKMSLTWMETINETINTYFGWAENGGEGLLDNIFESSNGTSMKAKFVTSLTKNFMHNAVKLAQQKSHIIAYHETGWTTTTNYADYASLGDPIASNFNSVTETSPVVIALNKNLGESPITDEDSIRSISHIIYNSKYSI